MSHSANLFRPQQSLFSRRYTYMKLNEAPKKKVITSPMLDASTARVPRSSDPNETAIRSSALFRIFVSSLQFSDDAFIRSKLPDKIEI
ncbi:unnamed protein product [Haemonchus placei]|uniref:Uncharacterized protein n=1 Tax=Haemonchus placei TaxID=6290 RepID=A0A0N4WZH2_HAEPC|nr:unnamed protein product [Haemonchus placei]